MNFFEMKLTRKNFLLSLLPEFHLLRTLKEKKYSLLLVQQFLGLISTCNLHATMKRQIPE